MGGPGPTTPHVTLLTDAWGRNGSTPKGTQNPWSGTSRGHGGPRPLLRPSSDLPLHLKTASPATTSSSRALLPHQLSPYRAPQRHGDPQAGLSLSNPGPLAPGSGSVFLARAHPHTHTPLICAPFHLLFHTVKKLFSLNSYPCPGLDGGTEVANHPRKKPAHSAVPTQKPLLGRHELCSPSGPWEQGHLALAPPPDLR